MTRKCFILLEAELPEGCNAADFRSYVNDAVRSWSGQFEPDHPLLGWFHQRNRLRVRVIPKTFQHRLTSPLDPVHPDLHGDQ